MRKDTKQGIKIVVILAIIILLVLGFLKYGLNLGKLSILPELDNRINYYDNITDITQAIQVSSFSSNGFNCRTDEIAGVICFENDKFLMINKGAEINFYDDYLVLSSCFGGNTIIQSKKSFANLNGFIRTLNVQGGQVVIVDGVGKEFALPVVGAVDKFVPRNYEIKPNNLVSNAYDFFADGEFVGRTTFNDNQLYFRFISSGGYTSRSSSQCNQAVLDYIKFVPIEAFTIKNDEVWVTYRIKNIGTTAYDYTFEDIQKQQGLSILGFHSLIEPATIRDLTAQTEVPEPRIYGNLISNQLVTIQPNTIHKIVYRTKYVNDMPPQCKGDSGQAVEKQPDGSWACGAFVKETPITQQCSPETVKQDCPILQECEAQRDLITCEARTVNNEEKNLCIYDKFSPACKNQLITYQDKLVEVPKEVFIDIPSGGNSFTCFFDETKTSCQVGEKIISVSEPAYICNLPSDSSTIVSSGGLPSCWQQTLTFDNALIFKNDEIKSNIGFGIKGQLKMSASLDSQRKLRKSWGTVGIFTMPDDFLETSIKSAGSRFVLQNSADKINLLVTNKLGFGIDGGYSLLTKNLALEGGKVLRDDAVNTFLKNGVNEISFDKATAELGTIVDDTSFFGKITTHKEYILKSGSNNKYKILSIPTDVVIQIPSEIGKVQPITTQIIERRIIREIAPVTIGEGFDIKQHINNYGIIYVIVVILIGMGIWYYKRKK